MPATNDLSAHNASLPTQPNSVNMLNGQRYSSFQSNQPYNIPESSFIDVIAGNNSNSVSQDFKDFVSNYIQDHIIHQLPRIIILQRYYQADNDIHYWKSDKIKRADNRIASAQAKYITNSKHFLNYIQNVLHVTKDTAIGIDVESSMDPKDNILNDPDITGTINVFIDNVYDAGYRKIVLYASKDWLQHKISIKRLHHDPYLWVDAYGTSEPSIDGAGAWQFTNNWNKIDCSYDFGGLITGKAKQTVSKPKNKPK